MNNIFSCCYSNHPLFVSFCELVQLAVADETQKSDDFLLVIIYYSSSCLLLTLEFTISVFGFCYMIVSLQVKSEWCSEVLL